MLYYDTKSLDPSWNLSCEEYFLDFRSDIDEIFSFWQNGPSVIIGRYQNAESEINLKFIEDNHVKLVRRPTGGGAVYHDEGNVNYTLIKTASSPEEAKMRDLAEPIIKSLSAFGVPVAFSGRNDIIIDGKKISGTAQRYTNGRVMQHGALLYSADLDRLTQSLKVDAAKILSKGVSSVRSRVANLIDYLPEPFLSTQDFIQAFYAQLEMQWGPFEHYQFTEKDLQKIQQIFDRKYGNWDWNYGHAPAFNYFHSNRFDCGKLEVSMNVDGGNIRRCRICGDFLGGTPIESLEEIISGLPYRKEALRDRLKNYKIEENFGGITLNNLLEVMFAPN